MAYNIRTILKIFLIFLTFQASLITILSIVPNLNPTLTQEDQNYISFLNSKTSFLNTNTTNVLTNLKLHSSRNGDYTEGIASSFVGVYILIASTIEFVVQIAIDTLICPTIMIEILLYNFNGSLGSLNTYLGILVNIGFYSLVFLITFRESFK